jgi:hypothetical protein
MIRIVFILTIVLSGTVTAMAALPPFWQRKAEIQAILDSQEIADKLQPRPIDAIEYIEDDHYRVRSDTCVLDVLIVDDKSTPGIVGPRKFKLELGKSTCK